MDTVEIAPDPPLRYKAINRLEIVKKAWELCKVGEINLSYECLTSPEVRQALVGLRKVDSALYEQLSMPPPSMVVDSSDDEDEGFDGFGHDDSSRPKHVLEPFDARFSTSSWTRWDSTT